MRSVIRFLAFLPLIEVVLIVLVWRAIGPWWTLGLLFAGSLAGLTVLRLSPMRTVLEVRSQMARGQFPGAAVLDGVALGVAGMLLIVPGFFSDFLALPLLFGPARRLLLRVTVPRTVVSPVSPSDRPPIEGHLRRDGDIGPT